MFRELDKAFDISSVMRGKVTIENDTLKISLAWSCVMTLQRSC